MIDVEEMLAHIAELRSERKSRYRGRPSVGMASLEESDLIVAVCDTFDHLLRALSDRVSALENQIAALSGKGGKDNA